MFYRYFVSLFLILLVQVSYCQDDIIYCADKFVKGKFASTTSEFVVIRTKRKQKDILMMEGKKIKIVSKVKWTSDSEFTLTTIRLKNVPENWGEEIGLVMYVRLIDCDDGMFKVSVKQKGFEDSEFEYKKIK